MPPASAAAGQHAKHEGTPLLSPVSAPDLVRDHILHFRLTGCYLALCLAVAFLCLGILSFGLADLGKTPGWQHRELVLLGVEGLVTAFIFGEIMVDAYLEGLRRYCLSWWRLFDVVVGVSCAISLGMCLRAYALEKLCHEFLGEVGLFFRTVLQIIRVLWLFRVANKAKEEQDAVQETFIAIPGH